MLIKMIAKVYGHREKGHVVPKTPADPPFEVDEATARRLVGKNPLTATAEELAENRRSHSAKLRVLEKLANPSAAKEHL